MSIYFYKNYFDFCRGVCFADFESNKNIGRPRGVAPTNVENIYHLTYICIFSVGAPPCGRPNNLTNGIINEDNRTKFIKHNKAKKLGEYPSFLRLCL